MAIKKSELYSSRWAGHHLKPAGYWRRFRSSILKIALFRFGVISDLVGATRLEHGERSRRIRQKAAARWNIPHSTWTRVSANTTRRWVSSL